MKLISLNDATERQLGQAAATLVEALRHFASAWDDVASARTEVESFLGADRLAIAALENEEVIGWVGAIRHTKHLWELHPLVVHPNHQRKGVGKALVERLESEAHQQGVSTLWLGTDDDFGGTNIFGKNLYPNIMEHVLALKPTTGHPYTFYQAMGYSVVGIIPDASGFGKHDILMAKRISWSGKARTKQLTANDAETYTDLHE